MVVENSVKNTAVYNTFQSLGSVVSRVKLSLRKGGTLWQQYLKVDPKPQNRYAVEVPKVLILEENASTQSYVKIVAAVDANSEGL